MATSTTKLNVAYLDFDSIKASLRDFLRSQTQFKDYNFEGAGLSVLLDLLSYNTHYFGFYLNMIANEMFLDSASLRSSVVSLAKHLSYTPRSVTSATATVSIAISPNDGASAAVIDQGTPFTTSVNGQSFTFVTNQAYGATIQNGQFTFPTVGLVQGIPYTYRWTVDSSIPNQRFVLPNSSVDTSSLVVRIQTSATDTTLTSFSLATDLLTLTSTSNVYFLQEVENEQFQVYFGDGIIGAALQDGNVVIIDYILSAGTAANSALAFVPASTVAGYQKFLTTVTTLTVAAGGKDPETIDEIKFAAPKNYEAQGRAVTASDYKLLVEQDYTNADSVAVWGGEDNVPPQYGKVYISIKPVLGFVITETTKALVVSNIVRQRNIVSVIPELVDPDYTFIIVNCTVKYNPSNTFKTDGDIRSGAYNAIVAYAQANLDKFDLELRYSRLLSAIDDSDPSITNNLTTIQMKKTFTPRIDVVENYEFYMNNPVAPGTLTSTPFITLHDTMLKVAYQNGNTYTIQDDGQGNLVMYQHGIGIPDSIVRNCGTIDYTAGHILIQEIIPQQGDVNGNISIMMSPAQNDIIPVRNNILFIQPSDIFVTAVANAPITS